MRVEWESILSIHWGIECPRTLAAIEILKNETFDTLIACGWVIKNWASEAEIIEDIILNTAEVAQMLSEVNGSWIEIKLEDKSFDTRENIKNILSTIDIDKVSKLVFLSSHWHAKRIQLIFNLAVKYELTKEIGAKKASELIQKVQFVNAEEILQDIVTKKTYQDNKDFFDNFFTQAYSADTKKRERILRIITRIWIWKYRFWLKILNILAKRQRRNLDQKLNNEK